MLKQFFFTVIASAFKKNIGIIYLFLLIELTFTEADWQQTASISPSKYIDSPSLKAFRGSATGMYIFLCWSITLHPQYYRNQFFSVLKLVSPRLSSLLGNGSSFLRACSTSHLLFLFILWTHLNKSSISLVFWLTTWFSVSLEVIEFIKASFHQLSDFYCFKLTFSISQFHNADWFFLWLRHSASTPAHLAVWS